MLDISIFCISGDNTMTTINPLSVINISELSGTYVFTFHRAVAVDGSNLYIDFAIGYVWEKTNYILKFDLTDNSYSILEIGSSFLDGFVLTNYNNDYLVGAAITSTGETIRIFVIDKSTFTVVNTLSYATLSTGWGSPENIFIRQDGGITVTYYRKDDVDESERNEYILNLNSVSDISTDTPTELSHFLLGPSNPPISNSNGVYVYKPDNGDLLISNKQDFQFVLHTTDGTLSTLYYSDGTQAPVPFTPNTADYSKSTSVLSHVTSQTYNGINQNILDTNYYIAGHDLNGYAGYEIRDTNFNILNSKITTKTGDFFFYGSTTYFLYKNGESMYLYDISTGNTIQLSGSYSPSNGLFAMYVDTDKIYIIDSGSTYSEARISIFNSSDFAIIPTQTNQFPFWLRKVV